MIKNLSFLTHKIYLNFVQFFEKRESLIQINLNKAISKNNLGCLKLCITSQKLRDVVT